MRTIDETKARSERDRPRQPALRQFTLAALSAIGAGLVASVGAVLVMSLLRLAVGIPSPVELFGDHVLKNISVGQFIQLLGEFKSSPKTGPLGLTLLAMIGLGTALGLLYALVARVRLPAAGARPARGEWLVAAALALVLTLVGGFLFWGEVGQSFIGLPLSWAVPLTLLGLLLDFACYALVLCLAYRMLLPKRAVVAGAGGEAGAQEQRTRDGRRQVLARAGVAALGVGAAGGSLGLIKGLLTNYTSYDGMETFTTNGFVSPITPNSEHYTVTQNAVDPAVDAGLWRLEVTGLVGKSGSYTLDELQTLPSTSRAITLECIANGIGGHLISTAIWQGVTMRTLLERHGGAVPDATHVAFYAVDGYVLSQPLDVVLQADALLAWRMNGAELPIRHGYPLRALIPGRYGEENAKWLTRLDLTDHFVGGLYADQGWYTGPLHTITRIDRPAGRIPLASTVEIGGIAFAGNRGIQQVEASTDGGATWHAARLQPPLSQDAWVFWTWQWRPLLPGRYRLVARATDGTGALQTAQKQGTVPNGATGYHAVVVQVG